MGTHTRGPAQHSAVTPAAGRLAAEQGRGAAGRSRQLPRPKLIPFCGVPVQGQQPCGTELSVHSTATKRPFVPYRKNKQQRQLCVSLQAHTAGLERETSFPKRPVCPSGYNHRCGSTATQCRSRVLCEFPYVWQGACHTHCTHPQAHTQNPVSCCPAQQGCESMSQLQGALGRHPTGPAGAITLFFLFSAGATKGPRSHLLFGAYSPLLFSSGPTAHSREEYWATSEKDLFTRSLPPDPFKHSSFWPISFWV